MKRRQGKEKWNDKCVCCSLILISCRWAYLPLSPVYVVLHPPHLLLLICPFLWIQQVYLSQMFPFFHNISKQVCNQVNRDQGTFRTTCSDFFFPLQHQIYTHASCICYMQLLYSNKCHKPKLYTSGLSQKKNSMSFSIAHEGFLLIVSFS